ncbi:GSCOCG00004102001-RA-CDS [Cotesia congregata]|nr:GSCOCG00004102001-RA-CDS [Cotesia congregata]
MSVSRLILSRRQMSSVLQFDETFLGVLYIVSLLQHLGDHLALLLTIMLANLITQF